MNSTNFSRKTVNPNWNLWSINHFLFVRTSQEIRVRVEVVVGSHSIRTSDDRGTCQYTDRIRPSVWGCGLWRFDVCL